MSMIEQYPAHPECVYGTREFEERRNARMAAMRKPVRRVSEDVVPEAPFAGLRGAVAHYAAIRDRLVKAHVRAAPAPVVPTIVQQAKPQARPVVADSPAIPAAPFPPAHWYTRDAQEISDEADTERDWIVVRPVLNCKAIIAATARHYRVSVNDILSQRRTASVIRPRHVAMYLCKTLTLRSLPEIGRRFSGRDHSTAWNAIHKITGLVAIDADLQADVAAIRATLGARDE